MPSVIQEFNDRFRSLDLEAETRNASSIYRAIFNLFVINGARDWVSGSVPQADEVDDHHIVPASWGKKNGLAREVDTILNRSPLTSATNRHWISDRLPNEYLPKLIEASSDQAVRANFESHLISRTAFDILLRSPFTKDDFNEFITERRRTIMENIEHLLVKDRLDLSPGLRALDAEIEEVELGLRDLLSNRLKAADQPLPETYTSVIAERVERDRKKGLLAIQDTTPGSHETLQYLDLRHIEGAMVSKPCWPLFETIFVTREHLASRFAQLAELRNAIKHSRAVSQVVQKDGEAALIWFRERLASVRNMEEPIP